MYAELFEQNFAEMKNLKFAVYGTGIIASELVMQCDDYNFVAIYDRNISNGVFHGIPIESINEINRMSFDVLIIAAQPQNLKSIFVRIKQYIELKDILVRDINGVDLIEKFKFSTHGFTDENCFISSEQALKMQIEQADVVTFDIFDTLIMRRVYEPHDVFKLVEKQAKKNGVAIPFDFYEKRILAEINLIAQIPNIYELYDELRRITGMSVELSEKLMEIEISVERKVLVERKKMVEIFNYAKSIGKIIYIITDMYIPTDILSDILCELGIFGYKKIYNSCDFHRPKVDGLFDIFLSEHLDNNILHIGDNEYADGQCPNRIGIQSFVIQKATDIFEKTCFGDAKRFIKTWNDKVICGIWVSVLFNNPFCIDGDRVLIDSLVNLILCGIGPSFVGLACWLKQMATVKNKGIVFGSRDGWLFYKLFKEDNNIAIDIKYIYISRNMCINFCGIDEKEAKYNEYLQKEIENGNSNMLFFDLASAGTCLYYLSLFGHSFEGVFLYRYNCDDVARKHLRINSFFAENAESNFWRFFKFFELIITSPEPSVYDIRDDFSPVFEKEFRSKEELAMLQRMQDLLIDFYNKCEWILDDSRFDRNLLDIFISVFDDEKVNNCFQEKNMMYIYDSYGKGRINVWEE